MRLRLPWGTLSMRDPGRYPCLLPSFTLMLNRSIAMCLTEYHALAEHHSRGAVGAKHNACHHSHAQAK